MKDRRSILLIVSALLIVVLLLVSYGISQSGTISFVPPVIKWTPVSLPPTETRRPGCVPYPQIGKESAFRTATPAEGEKSNDSAVISVTPRPIAHTYNLSPNADPVEQAVILIYRCNGTYDQYIVGLDIKIPEDLHLGVGDTIIESFSVGIHSLPPPTLSKITNTPVITNIPLTPVYSSTPVNTAQSTSQPKNQPYPSPPYP